MDCNIPIVHLVAQLSNQKRPLRKLVQRLDAPQTQLDRERCAVSAMPKHVRLGAVEIAGLADCFRNGAAIQEAADLFGVHRTTARTHLIRLGLWPR